MRIELSDDNKINELFTSIRNTAVVLIIKQN